MSITALRSCCESVLRRNWREDHTATDPAATNAKEGWNSAVSVIGWAHIDPSCAWTELTTWLLNPGQRHPAGHKSAVIATDRIRSLMAGHLPPFWASATRRVVEISGLTHETELLLPMIDRLHQHLCQHRDPLGFGLIAVESADEGGTCGSPIWTQVRRSRQGKCLVYDPFASALLARAETDLAWLADQVGWDTEAERRAAAIIHGLETQLWDAESGCFRYFDVHAERFVYTDTIACYTPIWSGVSREVGRALEARLKAHYACAWPLPSVALAAPEFAAATPWSGATSMVINWMFLDLLGPDLGERSLELLSHSGIRQGYDPRTGAGIGSSDCSITAALAIDLLESGYGSMLGS